VKEGDLVAGRYRLLRPIGAGAMATVWAARHELLGRELALKIAAVGDRDDRARRDARDLFLREVRIIGKLRHPNVVDIADAGETGGEGLYLAMELLQGESLAQRIARGPLRPASALGIAGEVARGLAAAHAAGVVHRDLKPENVFLASGALGGVVPKLLDFGVSSARGIATLHRGKMFGTPAYMSPEQALGERDIDHRTDVWALGVVLYEMLTGRLPFRAQSYPALLPLIIEAPHPPLPASIPAEVRTVVAGCLAKDRSDRYPTADALREAIDRARAALPAVDPTSTRSGFFIEAFPARTALAGQAADATATRTARFGLAFAILAVPVAIGIAAVATGIRAHKSPAAPAAPAAPAQTGEPSTTPQTSVTEPVTPASAAPTSTASSTAPTATTPKVGPETSATAGHHPPGYAQHPR
jgi:eukaryotic-like serine/threonine-protein kinase